MVPSSKKSGVTWIGQRQGRDPALSLAIFGKHPGWDDHIDDLGLDTPRLVDAKRTLYLDALSGNIDSGAWEKLEPAQLLPAFGHELAWFSPAGLIVGRLWASRDGKGRTKYPMFVVAQCEGIASEGITDLVLPRLAEVERLCSSTLSAADVRRVLDDARAQLREAIKPAAGEAEPSNVRALSAISDAPSLGPGRVGLHRILYEIQRELGPPRGRGDRKSVSRLSDGPAQHLRVPACASGTFESARLWAGLLAARSERASQVLVVRPLGAEYCDLIVGGVTASVLFCLRASLKGLPLASDVPYNLDPEFVAQCEAAVEAWRDGRALPEDAKEAPRSGSAPHASQPTLPEASDASDAPPKRWFKGWLGMSLAAAGVALAAGAGYVLTRDTKSSALANDSTSVVSPKPTLAKADPKPAQSSDLGEVLRRKREESAPQSAVPAKAVSEPASTVESAADAEAKVLRAKADAEARERALAAQETAAKEAAARDAAAKELAATESAAKLAEAGKAAAERDAFNSSLTRLTDFLERGFGSAEPVEGTTVRALADEIAGLPLYARVKDSRPDAKAISARIADLRAIEQGTDAKSLVQQASAAAPLAESVAAWERLVTGPGMSWPSNDAELASAAQALVSLKSAANRLKDGARATALSARIESGARVLWSRALGSAVRSGDAQGVSAVCGRMGSMGVTKDTAIAPSARFNVLLWELKHDLATMGNIPGDDTAKVAALRERVERFAGEPGVQAARALKSPEPAATESALSAALTTLSTPAQASAPEPAPMGPALRGWSEALKTIDGITHATFTPPGGGPSIEFVRVEAPSGSVFLGTTECSVGDFIRAVESAAKWGEVAKLMASPNAKADARSGARTWTWTQFPPTSGSSPGKIQVSAAAPGDTSAGWLSPLASMANQAYYAGKPPEPPSPGSPMNQVTVPAAVYVASLLGCRLPTSDEWLAAAGDARLVNPNPNYRDASWKGQLDYIRGLPPIRRADFPDEGVFWPVQPNKSAKRPVLGSAEPVVTSDDGFIWFAPVSLGDGVLKHLLGNVAELCLNQPPTPTDLTPEAALAAVGRGEAVRFVGGSALSPREVEPRTPYSLEARSFGTLTFSDVGFRLAFSPGPGKTNPAKAPSVRGGELAGQLNYIVSE